LALRRLNLFIVSIFISVFFWVGESWIHFLVFKEPRLEWFPRDPNELWMRLLVCLLIIGVGYYGQRWAIERVRAEKLRTLKATLATVQDIVGNALNSFQLICVEIESGKRPDKETAREIYGL